MPFRNTEWTFRHLLDSYLAPYASGDDAPPSAQPETHSHEVTLDALSPTPPINKAITTPHELQNPATTTSKPLPPTEMRSVHAIFLERNLERDIKDNAQRPQNDTILEMQQSLRTTTPPHLAHLLSTGELNMVLAGIAWELMHEAWAAAEPVTLESINEVIAIRFGAVERARDFEIVKLFFCNRVAGKGRVGAMLHGGDGEEAMEAVLLCMLRTRGHLLDEKAHALPVVKEEVLKRVEMVQGKAESAEEVVYMMEEAVKELEEEGFDFDNCDMDEDVVR